MLIANDLFWNYMLYNNPLISNNPIYYNILQSAICNMPKMEMILHTRYVHVWGFACAKFMKIYTCMYMIVHTWYIHDTVL